MQDDEPDIEVILQEMHANDQWLALTQDQRDAWATYIHSEGTEWRRARAMEVSNRLLDGKTAPPSMTPTWWMWLKAFVIDLAP